MYFFSISLKNKLLYRWEAIANVLTNLIFVIVNIFLWVFLYRSDESMIVYMIRYTVMSHIIGLFYLRKVTSNIERKIKDGSFVLDLLKPINFFFMTWQIELSDMLTNLLLQGVPLILCFSYFFIINPQYFQVIPMIAAILLGHVFYFLIYSLIGLLSFIFVSVSSYARLVDDTIRLLSGSFIPLTILPGSVQTIAKALPFHYLYSFPLVY